MQTNIHKHYKNWVWFILTPVITMVMAMVALYFVAPARAATGINEQINYQGRLLTATGAVVPDGSYNMEFKIVKGGDGCNPTSGTFPCSGTVQWTETRESGNKVLVKNGYFSVYLGSVTAFGGSVDWNDDTLWLAINIGGTGTPSYDGVMKPLTRFSSTPYALNTKYLGGLQASNFVQLAQGAQTDSSNTNPSIYINKTGSAGILQLQSSGADVLTVTGAGNVSLTPSSSSGTAFSIDVANSSVNGASIDIQSFSSSQYAFRVTSNNGATTGLYVRADGNVGIGTATPGGALELGAGQILLPDGSAGSPSLSFSGATNYGIYRITTNLGFSVGGSARAFLTSTAFRGAGNDTFSINVGTRSATTPTYSWRNDEDTGISSASADILGLVTGGTERLRVDGSGNVGIGTSSFGTSAAAVFALGQATAPSTSPADVVQLYVTDAAAGDARLRVRVEGGGIATFPNATGTIALLDGAQTFTNATWQGGVVASAYGGTGFSTYTTGDLLYASATDTLSKLARGSDGQCLTSNTTTILWGSCGAGGGGSLQDAYNNSSSPATITTTASAKNIVIKSGSGFNSTGAFQVVRDGSSTPTLNVDTTNNRVGIRTATPSAGFEVADTNFVMSGTYTTTGNNSLVNISPTFASGVTSTQVSLQNNTIFTPTGASLSNVFAFNNVPQIASNALNITQFTGQFNRLDTASTYTGAITSGYTFQAAAPILNGANKITNYAGVYVNAVGSSATSNSGNTSGILYNYGIRIDGHTAAAGTGGTINNYGMQINVPNGSGSAGTTNNYGLHIQGNSTSGDVNYAVYSESTANSYFAGNVGIGTTSIDSALEILQSSTSTTADTLKGGELTVTDTGVVTTGTDTTYGQRMVVTRTGATGGTINTTGLDISVTGDAGGASTVTGLSINVTGADTNRGLTLQGGALHLDYTDFAGANLNNGLKFGGSGSGEGITSNRQGSPNQFGLDFYTNNSVKFVIANGGNVGVGDSDPLYLFTVGSGDKFGIDSAGSLYFEGATNDDFEFVITPQDPTADRTYTIPNSTASTDTFCLQTLANCGGGGSTTLAQAYGNDADGSDAIIPLTSTDGGILLRDASSTIGTLFAIQNNGGTANYLQVTASAVTFQDSAGNNAMVFDSSTSELKIYENGSSPSNYARIYYSGGSAVFAASTGTTQVGSGSGAGGDINMLLSGAADKLSATKTHTAAAAYSVSDFNFTRNVTMGNNAGTGNVLKVEDLSTFTGGSSAPNVLYVNQNNTSATGNLILAHTGGSTARFTVNTTGDVDISGVYKKGGTSGTTVTCSGGQVLQNLTASGGIVTGGTCTTISGGLTGLITGDGTGATASGSGMEVNGSNVGLLQGCSDGQTLKWNEAASEWECGSDRATSQTVLTGNYTNTTTTFTDIDDDATGNSDMGFAVGANETWIFEASLQLASNTTADAKWQVTAPSGSTCDISVSNIEQAISVSNLACGTTSGNLAIADTAYNEIRISGSVVTNGTSGTVMLQYGQVSASGTVTIASGSYIRAYKVTGADLAEVYFTEDTAVMPGTLVSLDPRGEAMVKRPAKGYDPDLIGIISSKPGTVLGESRPPNATGRPVFLGLAGRVPLRVNSENGPIKPGDLITSSSTPGVGMKATGPGRTVGRALTGFEGEGEGIITVFIENGSAVSSGAAGAVAQSADGGLVASLGDGAKFVWNNSAGKVVAAVNSLGEAAFQKVTAAIGEFKRLIVDNLLVRKSAKLAGKSTLAGGQTELFIESDKITADSLVQLTATTSLGGRQLYVKELRPGQGFVVAIEQNGSGATSASGFNWLIVNQTD